MKGKSARRLSVSLLALILGTLAGCHRGSVGRLERESQPAEAKRADDATNKPGYPNSVNTNAFQLDNGEKRELLALARRTVETFVRDERVIELPTDLLERYPHLNQKRACFVTLRDKQQHLRGCIGSLQPYRPLVEDIIHNAVAAASQDPRFSRVQESELAGISYSISVLDVPRPLEGVSARQLPAYMAKHRPGVVLSWRGRRSTFLPSVWDELADPEDFLSHLCRKQGSPRDCWKDPAVSISVYGSVHFSEKELLP